MRRTGLHPFVTALKKLRSENAFNPYIHRCPIHDRPHAPRMRAALLSAVLYAAAERKVDALWVGRDLGHRGGRRTGLALTDDVHLAAHAARWGVETPNPTLSEPVPELTAKVVWEVLADHDEAVMTWNVFPLHPHPPGEPFGNRAHSAAEREMGLAFLARMIRVVRPARLVALGGDAARALERLETGLPLIRVRHPSRGGAAEFRRQIAEAW